MSSCFICPIYDMSDHFSYGLELFKTKIELQIKEPIFFIFTNLSQKDKFEQIVMSELGATIDFIVVPDEYNVFSSKAVTKKIYGLKCLYKKYDYIASIDCETKFIKHEDYNKLFKEIDEKRTCLNANVSYDGFAIQRKCYKAMGLYNNKKLRKATSNFKYNYWFNEIQVYNCSMLSEFFIWLKKFDKNAYLNEWCCFEYYLYAAFLIIEKGYTLKKFHSIKSMGGVMEYIRTFSNKKQIKILKKLDTHWTSNPCVINDNISIIFHCDRIGKNNYSYDKHFVDKIKMIVERFLILLTRR